MTISSNILKSILLGGTNQVYTNLIRECKVKGIKRSQIAALWEVSYSTAGDKLSGRTKLYLEEALKLNHTFFPEFRLEYLFFSMNESDESES